LFLRFKLVDLDKRMFMNAAPGVSHTCSVMLYHSQSVFFARHDGRPSESPGVGDVDLGLGVVLM